MLVRSSQLIRVLLLVASAAVAGLDWQTTLQEIKVHPLQASAVVTFGFTNAGSNVVNILDITSDCGCISGNVENKTFAPGESGAVTVTFDIGNRTGLQSKKLLVMTDDKAALPVHLTVSTTIPKAYDVSPKRLTWVGEQLGSQSFTLINVAKTPFRIEKAVSSSEGISLELKPIREGFEYELVVTPDAKMGKGLAPIIIYPEKPEGIEKVRTYTVYAMVL